MVNPVIDNSEISEPITVTTPEGTEGVVSLSDKEKTIDEAKEGVDAVRENIVGNATVQLEAQSSQYTLQRETQAGIDLQTYRGYIETLSQLIFEIDGCIETAKYKKGLNKSGKETLRTAKAKLKQYKDIMGDKKRMIEHEYSAKNRLNSKNPDRAPLEVTISSTEIQELKTRRSNRRQQIEFDIREGQSGKSSNTAPWPNQSLEQVKKGNRVDRHHIEYDSRLNEALQDAAFLRIIDNNQDVAREILQGIASNSLSDQQIVVVQSHMTQLSPYFEQYGLTDQVHRCIQTRGGRYNQSVQNYGNMDLGTAYRTGGVTGWLNGLLMRGFPNAKPDQVSNFTNIAVAAGGIYAIYRIGKWFFGKNKEGKRNILGKAALLAGGYFVPQLLVGQDGYSLLGDILTGKADFGELRYRLSNCLWFLNGSNPEVYSQMAPGMLGMTLFPQNYTVSQLRSLQQTFSDQNTRRQRYSVTYARLNEDNSALANEFKNTFSADEYKENEWKAFLAKIGITDNTSGETLVFSEAAKLTDKKTSFELWMKSQGKTRKSEFKQEIDNYLKQGGEFNPNDVKAEWFEENKDAKYTMRPEDIQNKQQLSIQVDSLSLYNQDKSELKKALETFYDERTIESKPNPNDFSLKTENGLLILTSHGGHETKIDLRNKKIEGFGPGINFTNLSELLNVADLANKVLETQKGKQIKDMPPFQYKIGKGGRGIYFNDAEGGLNFNFDTRVLSGGRGGKIGEISTLSNNPENFAKYLSERRIEHNKVNIDSSLYPTVKKLSDEGIDFFNEQEVKNLEIWLKGIKETLKFSVGDTNGNPFSIGGKKLKFKAVNGDTQEFPENISENFPTLLLTGNKEKFLKVMNDSSNKMRGSVHR